MNKLEQSINYYCQRDFEITRFDSFDYAQLQHIHVDQARRNRSRLNEIFIMLDTETSKSSPDEYIIKCVAGRDQRAYKENVNYIVKWSIALNYMGINLCCLWGDKPSDCVKTVETVNNSMNGTKTVVYVHNLAYDWVFLRKFFILSFGDPAYQLNTKPHYPIMIQFENGVELRDSLILSQRSIEKWGADMNVLHQKAVGKWEYDRIRCQQDPLTEDELLYISNDVIAGVECLDALRRTLQKRHAGMPYTATGIVRNDCREAGKPSKAHDWYTRNMADFEWYQAAESCYHGGYTHASRHIVGWVENDVKCFDFASSYPYVMLSEKFPCEAFQAVDLDKVKLTVDDVLSSSYACMVEFCASGVELKDYFEPMPNLQLYKCEYVLNPVVDNGRILKAEMIDIFVTEVDLAIIMQQYKFREKSLKKAWISSKDYLPKWFTDFVYQLFVDKTQLKGVDQIRYNIAKAKINACYGMTVQKICKDEITENYETGEYVITSCMTEEEYNKSVKRFSSFLPYYIGVYVTAYAMRNLYRLGSCVEDWLYTDTDSIYGTGWNMKKVDQYNDYCKKLLAARGYPGVEHKGREYWLGVAELDGEYSEFKTLGAKRYCCRDTGTGQLKITVAGVPKKTGVKCLNDDINNFVEGLVFDGETTGKLTHVYTYVDEIYTDQSGNEIGDSINLIPCDYLLDRARIEEMFIEEVQIQLYE